MGNGASTNGQGSLGLPQNSPVPDAGTNAITQHRPSQPHGSSQPDGYIDTLSPIGANLSPIGARAFRVLREVVVAVRGDAQGTELLNLWMSGTAPKEVTLDNDSWGDYMRAEPDLAEQIRKKLEQDACSNEMRAKVDSSSGTADGNYEATFHGQVGNKSPMGKPIDGGYFTGYELLHGSNRHVGDVQIKGKFKATRVTAASGGKLSEYNVTFSNLEFVWNDIVDANSGYSVDPPAKRYAQWENKYTGNQEPKDYIVHIKWKGKEPVTIDVAQLRTFPNQR